MNIEKYRKDIEKLVRDGKLLMISMAQELKFDVKTDLSKDQLKTLPPFSEGYQSWYSEALASIRQLLPDRVEDFVGYYKPLKPRKDITCANYAISDYLQGLNITRGHYKEKVVGPDAAFPALQQQFRIVESTMSRFESTLFDIRALVQAHFFDDELDVGDELNKKGFHRAAGAVAGVALEGHLGLIVQQHKIGNAKDAATISSRPLRSQFERGIDIEAAP
jgi:hypothetical protein